MGLGLGTVAFAVESAVIKLILIRTAVSDHGLSTDSTDFNLLISTLVQATEIAEHLPCQQNTSVDYKLYEAQIQDHLTKIQHIINQKCKSCISFL